MKALLLRRKSRNWRLPRNKWIMLWGLDVVCIFPGLCFLTGNMVPGLTGFQAFPKEALLMLLHVSFLCGIFELYHPFKVGKLFILLRNVLLTACLSVLMILINPMFALMLSLKHLQLPVFFGLLVMVLFLGRFCYSMILSAPYFRKSVILIGNDIRLPIDARLLNKDDDSFKILEVWQIPKLIQDLEGSTNHSCLPDVYKTVKTVKVPLRPIDVTLLNKADASRKIMEGWQIPKLTLDLEGSANLSCLPDVYTVSKTIKVDELLVDSASVSFDHPLMRALLQQAHSSGIKIREYSTEFELRTQRISRLQMERTYRLRGNKQANNISLRHLSYFRVIDIILSLGGLLLGVMLLPFILLGNFIGNRGSLFYRQKRVGKDGQHFILYKFRSMNPESAMVNHEISCTGLANPELSCKKQDSESASAMRITPFGRLLRKSRLDEFPQFYNILKGEMSVVGPRPELPSVVAEIGTQWPWYYSRHGVKPGLTGWAQVKFGYGGSLEDGLEKLQYDLYYIKHRSIWFNLEILVKTISTVIFFRGQ